MEKRVTRVSEGQWNILLDYLEAHPNLARTRAYNNSAQGRALSLRLWQEVATLLNAEGSGTAKSPKEWSIYVSNYKSKLKKVVADINADVTATGGGPPRAGTLSDHDTRFISLLGPAFGQAAPQVMVQPFPDELHQPSTSITPADPSPIVLAVGDSLEAVQHEELEVERTPPQIDRQETIRPSLPQRSRQRRQRSRPLAPLDEARRILAQVEMQRAAADAATARAFEQMSRSLDSFASAHQEMARSHQELARNVAEIAQTLKQLVRGQAGQSRET